MSSILYLGIIGIELLFWGVVYGLQGIGEVVAGLGKEREQRLFLAKWVHCLFLLSVFCMSKKKKKQKVDNVSGKAGCIGSNDFSNMLYFVR